MILKGALSTVRPDEMAATVISEALRRAPGVDPHEIDDVILGCAMPEAEQGLNVARIASLRAGVPVEASAVTINRFCSSGLQAIATAKRLGAQVSATDVRSATKEQIMSLGAKPIFVENVVGIEGEGAGGYATEMSPEYQKAQAESYENVAQTVLQK